MTFDELSRLHNIRQEIERDKERLVSLRAQAYAPKASKFVVAPGGGSHENRLERYVIQIAELEEEIAVKIGQLIEEHLRLERYIATIPDSLTRQIFTLRFVNGLSWRQISFHIGGGNTEEGVKKICYRYLKRTSGGSSEK